MRNLLNFIKVSNKPYLVNRMNLKLEGALTFFYYHVIDEIHSFYTEVMRFETVMDKEWVKLYKINNGAHLGIVDSTRGSHKPHPIKPVRLQLIVEDADSWFQYLKKKGTETSPKEAPNIGSELNIKAFSFKDPGGYTIEICEYTTPYGL